jgi:methionyl-tRNA formyltransferase
MRVVVFASGGPLSLAALGAIRGRAQVVGVVVPREPRGRSPRAWVHTLVRHQARQPLVRAARRLGVSVVWARRSGEADLEVALRALAPDLLVVTSFPRLLRPSLLALPRLGAVGLHASCLPRHRGPVPLFWTYVHDDPEAGITLFWLDAGEDTGPLISTASMPLARGLPVGGIYSALAEAGGTLLNKALVEIAAGTAPRVPQDGRLATREPSPRAPPWRIDYETWNAERVWHVLSGLGERHSFLVDPNGQGIAHGRATGFRVQTHGRPPGSFERAGGGFRLYCRDGVVEVDRGSRWREVRGALSRLFQDPSLARPLRGPLE